MILIDGKKVSEEMRLEIKNKVAELKKQGINPGLATILVGDDPSSHVYVASKIKACENMGISSIHHKLPSSAKEEEILELIESLNNNPRVNGILLQLPLPEGINSDNCLTAISPDKDVDGLSPSSLGKLFSMKRWEEVQEQKLLVPCTPLGVMYLLKKYGIEIAQKNAVVVGRSLLVGKPVAMLLLSCNATVTIAHSKTKNLAEICSKADILIAAIGKPSFIKKDFIKPGAVVIDVGINRETAGLIGDVDFDTVKDAAGYITPVPGGVGPMTITMLMHNTVLASQRR